MTTSEIREESLREMGCTPRITYSEFIRELEALITRLGLPGGYWITQTHARHAFAKGDGSREYLTELRWHLEMRTAGIVTASGGRKTFDASSLESMLSQVADCLDPERMPPLESLDVHTIADAAGATS